MISWRLKHTELPKNRKYAGVQMLVSKEEFVAWFAPLDFPGCSVDRIDPAGHYELSNMQVIDKRENARKDKVKAKNGRCVCFSCGLEKDLELFAKDKRRASGRSTLCKACDNKRSK